MIFRKLSKTMFKHFSLTCSAAPGSRASIAPAASWSRVLRATANGVCPDRSVTFILSSGWLSSNLVTMGCLLVMAIWIGLRLSESYNNQSYILRTFIARFFSLMKNKLLPCSRYIERLCAGSLKCKASLFRYQEWPRENVSLPYQHNIE